MLDKVTEELHCEEIVEEADSMEEVCEIVKEFQECPKWLMKCYQPVAYFTSEIEDKNTKEFVEVITLSLIRGATFPVTGVGINCNALIKTGAMRSC